MWLRRALCEGPTCTGWIQKGSLTGAHPLHSHKAQARQWGGAWARLSSAQQLQTIQLARAVTQIKSHLSLSEGFSLRKKGVPSAFLSADIEPPPFLETTSSRSPPGLTPKSCSTSPFRSSATYSAMLLYTRERFSFLPFLHLHSKMKQTRDLFSKMKSLQHRVFYFFFYSLHHVLAGSYFPDQGSNPCSLQWTHGILTTGPPGKSLQFFITSISFNLQDGSMMW